MAQLLKQSVAYTFRLGPFVSSSDGFTAQTALTLSQADFRLSKAGGAFAQKSETTSGSHDENGYYTCILNTTDTNTLGTLDIHVSETGALPVFKSFMVVPAQVYDSLVGGTDVLQADVQQWLGTAVATPSVAGVPEVDITHVNGAAQTATLDTIKAQTAAIEVDTTEIGVAGAGLTNINLPNQTMDIVGSITGNLSGSVGSVATGGISAASIAADAGEEIADAVLDRAAGVETNRTLRQALRLMLAALAGKASGMATTTATFRDTNDTVDRIVATVDADGNRTAVTLNTV